MAPPTQPFDVRGWSQECPPFHRTSETLPTTHRSRIDKLIWCLRWTLGTLVVCFVTSVLVRGYVIASSPPNVSGEADCLRMLSSTNSLNHFPLPYPIDRKVHGVVLEALRHPEILARLVRDRAEVHSMLATTTQEFVRFIAGVTQIYTRSPREYTNFAFYGDIHIVREQIRLAASQVDGLANLYGTVRDGYYTLNATEAEAFNKGRLSDPEEFWVCQKPWLLPRIGGFDANEVYLKPFEEKSRRSEEARLGLVAWERDTQRLAQIVQVIQEVDRILQHLAVSLSQWDPEIEHHGSNPDASSLKSWGEAWHSLLQGLRDFDVAKLGGTRDSRHRWLEAWFRQYMVGNGRTKEGWIELLTSVDHDIDQIVIEIKTEWCVRMET